MVSCLDVVIVDEDQSKMLSPQHVYLKFVIENVWKIFLFDHTVVVFNDMVN